MVPTVAPASRPSLSIVSAAVALLFVSLVILFLSVAYLKSLFNHAGSVRQVLVYAQSPTTALLDLLTIPQIVLSLLGIGTSIGLLRLRERARSLAIFLSVFPIGGLIFTLFIFAAETHSNGAESLNAGYGFLLYAGLLILVLPFCIWWFVLFTREKVRAQFH
jgi:hypothetical protein